MPDLEYLEKLFEEDIDRIVTIPFKHDTIHKGKHFTVSGFETVALNSAVILAVSVPSIVYPHMKFEVHGTSQTEVVIYENSQFSGGSAARIINNNRNSGNPSELTIVKDPTVSVAGDIIHEESAGLAGTTPSAGNISGTAKDDSEMILKLGTDYMFEITSREDGNIVSYDLYWYEVDVTT